MTLHYHGTPITPTDVMLSLKGRCFCVSHYRPEQIAIAHEIGQSVLLDNGAFSFHTELKRAEKENRDPKKLANWPAYYAWVDPWLDFNTTWAVIPDVIDAGSQAQDQLLDEWPHGQRGAPVWHTSEPLDRLYRLCDEWPRVCIGSTDEHWQVLSAEWCKRMDKVFNGLAARHRRLPWLHMLRGMQLVLTAYPFASVDSTDVGQNHNRPQNTARAMADRWDGIQCPAVWNERLEDAYLFENFAPCRK